MHGGRIEQLMEMRAPQPDGATPAKREAPRPLGEATLHTRSQSILLLELCGLLTLARSVDGLGMGLGPDGQLARSIFCPCARLPRRTDATRRPIKTAPHDRIAGHILAQRPFHTALPLR